MRKPGGGGGLLNAPGDGPGDIELALCSSEPNKFLSLPSRPPSCSLAGGGGLYLELKELPGGGGKLPGGGR